MIATRQGMSRGMTFSGWLGVLADLELEAEGLHLDQRAAEAADLGVAEYSAVTLAARLLGSVGSEVSLRLAGGLVVGGRLVRASEAWVLVAGGSDWLVPVPAILSAQGLTGRAVPDQARTVLARLSLAAALRRLGDDPTEVAVHLVDGSRVAGRVVRVGADFVELGAARGPQVVAHSAVVAVQEAR